MRLSVGESIDFEDWPQQFIVESQGFVEEFWTFNMVIFLIALKSWSMSTHQLILLNTLKIQKFTLLLLLIIKLRRWIALWIEKSTLHISRRCGFIKHILIWGTWVWYSSNNAWWVIGRRNSEDFFIFELFDLCEDLVHGSLTVLFFKLSVWNRKNSFFIYKIRCS